MRAHPVGLFRVQYWSPMRTSVKCSALDSKIQQGALRRVIHFSERYSLYYSIDRLSNIGTVALFWKSTYVIDFIYYTIPNYMEFWPMTDLDGCSLYRSSCQQGQLQQQLQQIQCHYQESKKHCWVDQLQMQIKGALMRVHLWLRKMTDSIVKEIT